jgi:SAM-dependent methyltransferase
MRKEKILTAVNPKSSKGMEIGPLDKPTVTRDMGDIRYVDHCTRADLVKKYSEDPHTNTDNIPEIDYVWGKQTLRELVGQTENFDYVIASHVIEHVPDLLGWLEEINHVLVEKGVLTLVIPDKRFTFDILRKESSPAEMVHAYLTKSRKPTVEQLFDCLSNYHEADLKAIWNGTFKIQAFPKDRQPLMQIYETCKRSLLPEIYFDNHCWVFTPYSFFELLKVAMELKIINFKVLHFYTTGKNKHEFYVTLEKTPSSLSPEIKYKEQMASLPAIPNEYIQEIGLKKNVISAGNLIKFLFYKFKNKIAGRG